MDAIEAACRKQETYVLMKFLATGKRKYQLVHDGLLFHSKRFRIRWVNRREEGVEQRIFDIRQPDDAARIVDFAQEQAVLHLILRTAPDHLALELELDDGDGLLHLRHQTDLLRAEAAVGSDFGRKRIAGRILVGVERERGEWQQADAVAVFQCFHVAVAQADAHDVGDAGFAAGSGAHPENVVVAPLDVDLVMFHQVVENDVCAGAAVIDVADDVQSFYGQLLDELREAGDEHLRTASRDDGIDLTLVVGGLVFDTLLIVKQFLDRFGDVFRQQLANGFPPVFCAEAATELDEPNQRQATPFIFVSHALH